MKTLALALALLAGAALAAPVQSPSPLLRPSKAPLDGPTLVARAALSGQTAFILTDLATGEVVEAHFPDLALPPASVAKAPTAFYALDRLGPDHVFETRLLADGPYKAGRIEGDLYLVGGADPELDTVGLDRIAEAAAKAGLRGAAGFRVDESYLPSFEAIEPTQPNQANYNPAISALNLNFNRAHVTWNRVGANYRIAVEARAEGLSPPSEALKIRPVARTQSGGDFDYAVGDDVEIWSIRRGALGRKGMRWLPVRRVADYAGDVFRDLSLDHGLKLPKPKAGAAPKDAQVLVRLQSRPLASILRDMLDFSTNLTAEVVGLAATRAGGSAPATLAASAASMNAWAAAMAGPNAPQMRLLNHSGLSGASRVSPRGLTALFAAADKRAFPLAAGGSLQLFDILEERDLSVKGEPPLPADALVRAKTGTLTFTSALGGYVDAGARRFAFAIISADLARRGGAPPQSRRARGPGAWAKRARFLQVELLRSWIRRFGVTNG